MNLKEHIRGVPDFPKPGIVFYDISTLLKNPDAWSVAISRMGRACLPYVPDVIVGIESRGFLFAAPLAAHLGCGLVLARKPGKLPAETASHTYTLEYGEDTIEIHADAIEPGQRVLVVDDLLATGGTLAATIELVRKLGGEVCAGACLIELDFLQGRKKLDVPFTSLLSYAS